MYPESVVRDHGEMLRRSVWGNPHSESPRFVLFFVLFCVRCCVGIKDMGRVE